MPQMPSLKILAFVEGTMEQLFLNNNFNYVEVIPVSNGTTWTVNALGVQILTFFKARDANADHFVVWVDRERRSETSQEISTYLKELLVDAGAEPGRVHVMVSDVMTENIILADEVFIRTRFGNEAYNYEAEGRGGKHILKKMFMTGGSSYRETVHGVAALKAIRLNRAAQTSASVARFLENLSIPCWWLGTDNV